MGVLQLSSENLYAIGLEPLDARFRGARYGRYAEEGTYRGADNIRIVEVALRVADDDGIDMGSISRAEDGPHIARFLYTLQNDYQRRFAQMKLVKGVLPGDNLCDDTLGASTICHLIIYVGRNLEESGTIGIGLYRAVNVRTPEEGVDLIAAFNATLYFPPTLYDKQSVTAALLGLLLQFKQQPDLRILGT